MPFQVRAVFLSLTTETLITFAQNLIFMKYKMLSGRTLRLKVKGVKLLPITKHFLRQSLSSQALEHRAHSLLHQGHIMYAHVLIFLFMQHLSDNMYQQILLSFITGKAGILWSLDCLTWKFLGSKETGKTDLEVPGSQFQTQNRETFSFQKHLRVPSFFISGCLHKKNVLFAHKI